MTVGNAQHRDILAGLQASAKMDAIMRRNRKCPRFPPEDRVAFRNAAFNFVKSNAALVHYYHPHTALFNVTSKTHYVLHIGMIAAYINPIRGSVWRGEDMMRVVRRLVAAASVSNNVVGAQNSAVERYARAIGFEMAEDNC